MASEKHNLRFRGAQSPQPNRDAMEWLKAALSLCLKVISPNSTGPRVCVWNMIRRVSLAGTKVEVLDLEVGQIYNIVAQVRVMPLLTFGTYLFKCFFNEAFKPLDGVASHHHTHTIACLATGIRQYEIKPHGLPLMTKQPSFKPHALQSCWSIKMIYCNGSGQGHYIVNTDLVSYCRNRLCFITPRGCLVAG